MTTSLDGRAMFVTNLNDKSIYGINIVDPDITPTVAVPFDTPVGAGQQLWAVTTYRNRLYLGYVDTGTRPGQSAAAAGMKAYVVSTAVDEMVDAVVGDPLDHCLAARADRRPRLRQGLQHGELANPGRQCEHAYHLHQRPAQRRVTHYGRVLPPAEAMEQLDRHVVVGFSR